MADIAVDLARLLHSHFAAGAGGQVALPPLRCLEAEAYREREEWGQLVALPSLEAALQRVMETGLAEQVGAAALRWCCPPSPGSTGYNSPAVCLASRDAGGQRQHGHSGEQAGKMRDCRLAAVKHISSHLTAPGPCSSTTSSGTRDLRMRAARRAAATAARAPTPLPLQLPFQGKLRGQRQAPSAAGQPLRRRSPR